MIYKKFCEIAELYDNNLCIDNLTYKEVLQKVEEKPVLQRNTCAIIYLPKSADIIIWQLALNKQGLAFLTLEYGQHSRLISAIEKCRPSCIISNTIEALENPQNYHCDYIVFSSGSTGEPKKIMLETKALVEVVLEQAQITDMTAQGKFLWLLNPAFDASLSDIYMTVLSGGHLIVCREKPSSIKSISLEGITHTDIPPVVFPIWYKYYQKYPKKFATLKHIVFGGEKANENLCHALQQKFNLYNAYGPTETTVCSSLIKVDSNWTAENIGLPLKGVEYKIVDGELHIGGHCAIGYDDCQLDKKFYIAEGIKWFISGDMAKYDKSFFYLGRKDRQFKYNGQLICPEEIESAALKCGADTARVEYNGKITLKYSGDMKKELELWLPSWMVPHNYLLVDLQVNRNWKTV